MIGMDFVCVIKGEGGKGSEQKQFSLQNFTVLKKR
jgi:hypothetical protein|tara:strand:- start:437 stop:541 length:105 start_codon:yes stop_codon:yes gene_type:complete